MSYSEFMSREERAEVDAVIHDCYIREDGSVRGHDEADEMFEEYIRHAVQAHREWAERLLEQWMTEGRRAFLKRRFKDERLFDLIHKGKKRMRTARRGTQRRDDEGRQVWVQEELGFWTSRDLEQAISQCVNRIEEERANIAMYRALLTLINETGESTVAAALESKDTTLEDYLASVDAA